jgi:hypothetical protein
MEENDNDGKKQILARLCSRPSLHVLYAGAYLQSPLFLNEEVSIIPLNSLGKATEAHFLVEFVRTIGADVSHLDVSSLVAQGTRQRPVVVLTVTSEDLANATVESAARRPILTRAEAVMAWATGNHPLPFATVLATDESISCGITHVGEQVRRQRLGFGNTGPGFVSQMRALLRAIEEDEHFAFALSMYRDAVREENLHFKAARYFACLEALAYRLKGDGIASREAVRQLFRPNISYEMQIEIDGKRMNIDVVEICGRIRDKLFHGVPFTERDLKAEVRSYFSVLQKDPLPLVGQIEAFCEVQLARWANATSPGKI